MEIQQTGEVAFTFSEATWIIYRGRAIPEDIRRDLQIARKKACAPYFEDGWKLDDIPDVAPHATPDSALPLANFALGNVAMEQLALTHFVEPNGLEKHVLHVTLDKLALTAILTEAEIAHDIDRNNAMNFEAHKAKLEAIDFLDEPSERLSPEDDADDDQHNFEAMRQNLQVTSGIISAIKAAHKKWQSNPEDNYGD